MIEFQTEHVIQTQTQTEQSTGLTTDLVEQTLLDKAAFNQRIKQVRSQERNRSFPNNLKWDGFFGAYVIGDFKFALRPRGCALIDPKPPAGPDYTLVKDHYTGSYYAQSLSNSRITILLNSPLVQRKISELSRLGDQYYYLEPVGTAQAKKEIEELILLEQAAYGIEYVTESAYEQIVTILPKLIGKFTRQTFSQQDSYFLHGIDLNSLPSGFLLRNHPVTHARNVLDYSDLVAQKNLAHLHPESPQDGSLDNTLTADDYQSSPLSNLQNLLNKKMQGPYDNYCDEAELHRAIIFFNRALGKHQITLEAVDVTQLEEVYSLNDNALQFNPLVLLDRWTSLLTQPNLKAIDARTQWEALKKNHFNLHGPVVNGLLAIKKYENTASPCGFIIPEMLSKEVNEFAHRSNAPPNSFQSPEVFHQLRQIKYSTDIDSEYKFWRYIAFQCNRNSIAFYRRALKEINIISKIDCNDKNKLISVLAGSTTGLSHSSVLTEEEQGGHWKEICELIEKTGQLTEKFVPTSRSEFIHRLDAPKPTLNILFIKYVASHIDSVVTNPANIVLIGWNLLSQGSSFPELTELSNSAEILTQHYKDGFYEGARFYIEKDRNNNQFKIDEYVKLQKQIHDSNDISMLLVPYLSTFSITSLHQVKQNLNCLSEKGDCNLINPFERCLSLFRDVNKALCVEDLKKIAETFLNNGFKYDENYISATEQEFKEYFNDGYLTRKKEELINEQGQLDQRKINFIASFKFSDHQKEKISSLFAEWNTASNNHAKNEWVHEDLLAFYSLITSFNILKNRVGDTFLNEILEKLYTLRKYFPQNLGHLSTLVQLLIDSKNISAFNQFYFFYKFNSIRHKSSGGDNAAGANLCEKFSYFIENFENFETDYEKEFASLLILNSDYSENQYFQSILGYFKKSCEAQPHVKAYLLLALDYIPRGNSFFSQACSFFEYIHKVINFYDQAQANELKIYALLIKFYKNPFLFTSLVEKIFTETAQYERDDIQFLFNLLDEISISDDEDGMLQFGAFLVNFNNNKNLFFRVFCTPPHPSFKTINEWHQAGDIEQKAESFYKNPYKRNLDNAFKEREFLEKQSGFVFTDSEEVFEEGFSTTVKNELDALRGKKTYEIREQFLHLKQKLVGENEKNAVLHLLCLCVEMLARTAWQRGNRNSQDIEAQEINTTQFMALYAMLKRSQDTKKILSEIKTGEGKSRIQMIMAACQVAYGRTVDFLTSDMVLAERDFLAYRNFFSALEINISLISLDTPAELYQINGVNFTDNGELILLRNQSDLGLRGQFIDPALQNRCVLIDEVDTFIHDRAQHPYTCGKISEKLKKFTWVYPLLVDFVKNKKIEDGFSDSLVQSFIEYVRQNESDNVRLSDFSGLHKKNPGQLKTWLRSACSALKMKKDVDYKITEEALEKRVRVKDADGYWRYTRQVLVLDHGRIKEKSTFALGIHQCLTVLENQKVAHANPTDDNLEPPFLVFPESLPQRTRFVTNFVSQYDEGYLFGVSGTTRSEAPRRFSDINYEKYDYIAVPRHNGLKRKDWPTWFAKDQTQQFAFIKKLIEKSPNRPVLLICKDDQSSLHYYTNLYGNKKPAEGVEWINAQSEKENERRIIDEAGTPGRITISTAGIAGRGTDIYAINLLVLCTYIPSPDEEEQIKGRTARFGKEGEYRKILNMCDSEPNSIDRSSYNFESQVVTIQNHIAENASIHEELQKSYAVFLEKIQKKFLDARSGNQGQEECWGNFLRRIHQDWAEKKDNFLKQLNEENNSNFKNDLEEFIQYWEKNLDNEFFKAEKKVEAEVETEAEVKIKNPSHISWPEQPLKAVRGYQTFFNEKNQNHSHMIVPQTQYDYSDDGQARIYNRWFAQTRANFAERDVFANFKAWKEGRGCLFADTKATFNGDRPLFANTRATLCHLSGTEQGLLIASGLSLTNSAVISGLIFFSILGGGSLLLGPFTLPCIIAVGFAAFGLILLGSATISILSSHYLFKKQSDLYSEEKSDSIDDTNGYCAGE